MWSVRLPQLRVIFLCDSPGPFDACLRRDPQGPFPSTNATPTLFTASTPLSFFGRVPFVFLLGFARR